MNTALHINDFVKLARLYPVIDVRSPGEFEAGHMPFAHNIPLFSDEERARVGIAYKQNGRERAIEIGQEIAEPKRSYLLYEVEKLAKGNPQRHGEDVQTLLIHCWRGGMRSERFANFLNRHEYKTHTLVNGYKSYRHSVLESFSEYLDLVLIGGETGSGKTEILKKMEEKGELVIDLEGLAHHKGSAFGSLGENPQPKQEQFENNLAQELSRVRPQGKLVWLEDEARNIGVCHLPNPLWEKMKAAPIVRLNIPKEERIERLVDDYGNYSKEDLSACILKIQKRLGPQHAKRALEELEIGNLRAVADISLTYYDKAYNYNHELRNFKDVFIVECLSSDASVNVGKVLDCAHNKNSKNNV